MPSNSQTSPNLQFHGYFKNSINLIALSLIQQLKKEAEQRKRNVIWFPEKPQKLRNQIDLKKENTRKAWISIPGELREEPIVCPEFLPSVCKKARLLLGNFKNGAQIFIHFKIFKTVPESTFQKYVDFLKMCFLKAQDTSKHSSSVYWKEMQYQLPLNMGKRKYLTQTKAFFVTQWRSGIREAATSV